MYLEEIVAAHRRAASADDRRLGDLIRRSEGLPAARGFAGRIRSEEHLSVIAEIKRRSPSKGDLHPGLDPRALATSYAAGGATCLSVLTDAEFFGGSTDDLAAARGAVPLPVLRKDFTVSALDVLDARLMGADCVLLIAAVLDDEELRSFHALATDIGLDALVEVHDERELDRALAVGAELVGVNQRDLRTFQVDQERAARLAGFIPSSAVRVAESGVRNRADALALRAAGYDAVLVGESIVTSGSPESAVRDLLVP